MKANFRLFLTLRSLDGKRSNMTFIDSIKKLSRYVILDDFEDTEIIQIVCNKYPYFSKLAPSNQIAEKLLEVYKSLSSPSTSLLLSESEPVSANFRSNLTKDARTLSLR